MLTPYQSQYYAWCLTRRITGDSADALAGTLMDSQVDLNTHQVEAALFACKKPLSRGVILADEVGLGKTIEAGLVISQRWAERRRRILIIVPANLRKQWHQELQDKFNLHGLVLEAKSYNAMRKTSRQSPFLYDGPVICSYQFAKSKANDIKAIHWDLVVLDEAHRLRNVYNTPRTAVFPALAPRQAAFYRSAGLARGDFRGGWLSVWRTVGGRKLSLVGPALHGSRWHALGDLNSFTTGLHHDRG